MHRMYRGGCELPNQRGSPLFDAEAVQQAVFSPPVLAHADLEIQVHVLAQLLLDLAAGGLADALDHLAAGADQDALLGVGFDPDRRCDDEQPIFAAVHGADLDLDGVRHLLERAAQDLLADEFGQEDLDPLVGRVARVEVERTSGSMPTMWSTSGSMCCS